MSDELKERMHQREKGMSPPYMFPDAVDVLFPTMVNTTCGNVIKNVWKAAWDEARVVVAEYEQESGRAKENPNEWPIQQCQVLRLHVSHQHLVGRQLYWCNGMKVCGCAGCQDPGKEPPDVQHYLDDEVEVIHECFQNLMRLGEPARKRAVHYLMSRMFEERR